MAGPADFKSPVMFNRGHKMRALEPGSPPTSSIQRLEVVVCLAVWCSAVFYSIYRASKSALDLSHRLYEDNFVPGWPFLGSYGRRRDVSDFEWTVFVSFVSKYASWVVVHVVASNCIKRTRPDLLPHFFVSFSLVSIVDEIGLAAAGFIFMQVVLVYLAHLTGRKWLCWTVSIVFLCFLNLDATSNFKDYVVESDSKEEFALAVVIAWISCRVLIFCMIKCDDPMRTIVNGGKGRMVLLAYCLYFPFLYTGPLVMYDDFVRDLFRAPERWTVSRFVLLIKQLFRYTFWFVFAEFSLHYFHGSALHYHPHLVAHLPLWSLCGLGFGMSQFFMVKYTVLYGLPAVVARAEGFGAPPPPKCIARIHLYSDMWKYFDFGLYTFLKRFIYIPLVGKNSRHSFCRKSMASLCCFAFVYMWHGATSNVLVWTALNFLGVTIESFGDAVAHTSVYRKTTRVLGLSASRHFKSLLTAPLLAMSAMSNFYFICGGDVGNIFIQRLVIHGSLGPTILILSVLFCMCHVSEAIRCRERRDSRDRR